MKRWTLRLLLLSLILGVLITLTPAGRRLGEAVILLADVWRIGREEPPPGGSGAVTLLEYTGPSGSSRRADLYCPQGGAAEARLLLAHGLVATGKDDSRLSMLGRAFSRRRFLVMIPDFPGMRALRASVGDIDEIRAAITALRGIAACDGKRRGSDPGADHLSHTLPTGVVGFSYAAGQVLLALDGSEPGVEFAVLFGGYYDLSEVILFLTTGRHRDGDLEEEGEILPQGRWILLSANAATVADREDERALRAIARRRIEDPQSDIDDLTASLGRPARAVLDLLSNSDPDRFEALLERTDPRLRNVIDALSPAKGIEGPLVVDLFLLHGRSDVVVPYSQSLKLRRAVRTRGTVRLALLGGFRHARVEDSNQRSWMVSALQHPIDSVRLIAIISDILARRRAPSDEAHDLAGADEQ